MVRPSRIVGNIFFSVDIKDKKGKKNKTLALSQVLLNAAHSTTQGDRLCRLRRSHRDGV